MTRYSHTMMHTVPIQPGSTRFDAERDSGGWIRIDVHAKSAAVGR